MPIPQPKKNESQNDYVGRCMHKIGKEDRPQDQKVAICINTYKNSKKKAKAEIEIDFSEEIKDMNKQTQKEETKAELNVGEGIQTTLLQMQNQYKIFHWQTVSFSQHKSFDEIVGVLSNHIDNFIETYMGKYGRVIATESFNFSLSNLAAADIVTLTNAYINFLIGLSNILDASKDSDLLNIRDEMLGDLNKLKYLLSLN